jgi:hypothetical protein
MTFGDRNDLDVDVKKRLEIQTFDGQIIVCWTNYVEIEVKLSISETVCIIV